MNRRGFFGVLAGVVAARAAGPAAPALSQGARLDFHSFGGQQFTAVHRPEAIISLAVYRNMRSGQRIKVIETQGHPSMVVR